MVFCIRSFSKFAPVCPSTLTGTILLGSPCIKIHWIPQNIFLDSAMILMWLVLMEMLEGRRGFLCLDIRHFDLQADQHQLLVME
jgi:hypothetical protein